MSPDEFKNHLQAITEVIVKATEAIEEIYFQLPVAGLEDPQFRERVYCYELYHQMRQRWPNVPYRLTGEVDKNGHPWIYGNWLDGSKPDFVIHLPGFMSGNLLVMEVKARNPTAAQIRNDLRKLTGYRRLADYFAAYYLVYGYAAKQATVFAELCRDVAGSDKAIDLGRIRLFNHSAPGKAFEEVPWPTAG